MLDSLNDMGICAGHNRGNHERRAMRLARKQNPLDSRVSANCKPNLRCGSNEQPALTAMRLVWKHGQGTCRV